MKILFLISIISILSAVQSLFGVGLLLFGTPTLLMLGFSFSDALVVLLPCSLVISLSQLLQRGGSDDDMLMSDVVRPLFTYAIPGVLLGLAFSLNEMNSRLLPVFVGVALLLSGVIRFSKHVSLLMSVAVKSHLKIFLFITGFIHGLSNMGGGLLVFYAPAVVHGKANVRRIIAAGYALFASIQLIALFILQHHVPSKYWMLPAVSLSCFLIFDRTFKRIPSGTYNKLLNLIIVAYGAAALYKAFF